MLPTHGVDDLDQHVKLVVLNADLPKEFRTVSRLFRDSFDSENKRIELVFDTANAIVPKNSTESYLVEHNVVRPAVLGYRGPREVDVRSNADKKRQLLRTGSSGRRRSGSGR